MYVCFPLSDNNKLRDGIKLTQVYPVVSCAVKAVCLAVLFCVCGVFFGKINHFCTEKIQM